MKTLLTLNSAQSVQIQTSLLRFVKPKTYHQHAAKFRYQQKLIKRVEGRATKVLKKLSIIKTGGRSDDQTPQFINWMSKRK